MANTRWPYKCTNCNTPKARDELTVKQVVFKHMGAGGTIIKSRVVNWLCASCLRLDADFSIDEFAHNKEVTR